jgi:hypothetical protein
VRSIGPVAHFNSGPVDRVWNRGKSLDFAEYEIDLNAKCSCGCMEGKRIHKIYRFPNGYGASVVQTPHKAGFPEGGYRILIIHFDTDPPDNSYCVVDSTPLTEGVLECTDWREVELGLGKIFSLAPEHAPSRDKQ